MKRSLVPILVAGTLLGACEQSQESTPPAAVARVTTTEAATDKALRIVESKPADPASAQPVEQPTAEMAVGDAEAAVASSTGEPAKNEDNGPSSSGKSLKKVAKDSSLAFESLEGKLGDVAGAGGLGLRGVGRGGGGLSERGIGLGSIGTVGRGGGVGYGKGSGTIGNKMASAPRVRVGSATVRGYSSHGASAAPAPRDPVSSTEAYKDYGTNKFTDASEDKFSTFSIDVDTGSYTIARRKLNDGGMPPKASVRVEEFVNYFGYNYPKPSTGAFRVSMEAAPSPFATDGKTQLLRVGVQGKTIAAKERKPVHLTFLVDVSGSMQRPDKIGFVKRSLRILTDNLKEGDTVAMATYAGRTAVLLEPTRAKGKIYDAIEGLSAGGSTAMASGLDLAYGLASKNFQATHENRVIVLSDGDANVGRTGWKEMLAQISGQVKKGVTLSTIGFGMGNYKDTTMEQLANKGNGNYFYVDSEKEALKIFGDQLDGTLQVIAKDVKIQVEFNPEAVHRYRLIGYENRDIADKDFRNDKVDAGEIGAGHTVTALYEVELKDDLPERIATVRVRHKAPHGSDKASEAAFALDRDDLRSSIGKSSKDFQFAAAVAAFAEKLRKSPYAKELTYDWILEIAQGATAGRSDRKEFVGLVKKARRARG